MDIECPELFRVTARVSAEVNRGLINRLTNVKIGILETLSRSDVQKSYKLRCPTPKLMNYGHRMSIIIQPWRITL